MTEPTVSASTITDDQLEELLRDRARLVDELDAERGWNRHHVREAFERGLEVRAVAAERNRYRAAWRSARRRAQSGAA